MRREAIKTYLVPFFPFEIATLISNYDSHLKGILSFFVYHEPLDYYYSPMHCLKGLHDGRIAIGANNLCQIINPITENCENSFTNCPGSVTSILELDDNRIVVVSGCFISKLQIWNLTTNKCNMTLENDDMYVTNMIVLWDGRIMISGSIDCKCLFRIWNISCNSVESFTNFISKSITVSSCIDLHKTGSCLIITNHHAIAMWNPKTKYFKNVTTKKSNGFNQFSVFLKNEQVITCQPNLLTLWTINKKRVNSKEYSNMTNSENYCMIELEDERLAFLNFENQLRIFDMKTNQYDLEIDLPKKNSIYNIAMLPNQDIICTSLEGIILHIK